MPDRSLKGPNRGRKVGRGDNIEITEHTNMVPLAMRRHDQWCDVLPKLLLEACRSAVRRGARKPVHAQNECALLALPCQDEP